ncbi:mycofactocin-coupled SDR family oxidoreductase [Nocardia sp. NPDC019395]|uniref:mycofactocin-coupled SDR family oxidoreductase n=1 Tax=Nocardia sp. NPDC019395 TaxID=3154686 RepID=UPI0033FB7572
MTRLRDRVAVVTGAAGGMGRAHCRRLAEEGADIIAVDLAETADALAAVAYEVEGCGRRCVTGFADIRDPLALEEAVNTGVVQLGRLDIVVANAGVYADLGPAWELSDESWQRALDINLTGVWHTVRAGAGHLGAGGSIVIVGSTNGVKGGARATHYSASKHAVVGLARTMANELGPQGIRVNTVHPGSVATPMILNDSVYAKLRPDLPNPTREDAARVLAERTILPVPWVEPVDISNAVLFLASDESRYVTGIELVVDAGLTQKV